MTSGSTHASLNSHLKLEVLTETCRIKKIKDFKDEEKHFD